MKYITAEDEKVILDVIHTLNQEAYQNSEAHGFWEEYNRTLNILIVEPKLEGFAELAVKYDTDTRISKIALMHSELGEMTEGVRKPGPDQHCPEFTQEEIELADVLIRAFDYAGKWGLRLGPAVLEKMKYNESRPYKHGKAA